MLLPFWYHSRNLKLNLLPIYFRLQTIQNKVPLSYVTRLSSFTRSVNITVWEFTFYIE